MFDVSRLVQKHYQVIGSHEGTAARLCDVPEKEYVPVRLPGQAIRWRLLSCRRRAELRVVRLQSGFWQSSFNAHRWFRGLLQ